MSEIKWVELPGSKREPMRGARVVADDRSERDHRRDGAGPPRGKGRSPSPRTVAELADTPPCPPAPEPGGVHGGPRGRPRRPRKGDGLCLRARPLGSCSERRPAERASGGHGGGHDQGVRRRPEALSGRRRPDLPRQRRPRPRSGRPVRHRGGGRRLRHPSPRPAPLPHGEGRGQRAATLQPASVGPDLQLPQRRRRHGTGARHPRTRVPEGERIPAGRAQEVLPERSSSSRKRRRSLPSRSTAPTTSPGPTPTTRSAPMARWRSTSRWPARSHPGRRSSFISPRTRARASST